MPDKIMVSASIQDYLEAILNLSEKNSAVRITDLAKSLDIAKASVTGMINTMAQQGLIRHERYGPLMLTATGKKVAEMIRHRHRVLKEFLTEALGVHPETAELEACRMEHVISPDTTDKLVQFLETGLNSRKQKP